MAHCDLGLTVGWSVRTGVAYRPDYPVVPTISVIGVTSPARVARSSGGVALPTDGSLRFGFASILLKG